MDMSFDNDYCTFHSLKTTTFILLPTYEKTIRLLHKCMTFRLAFWNFEKSFDIIMIAI